MIYSCRSAFEGWVFATLKVNPTTVKNQKKELPYGAEIFD
jgi:hypothetical protein